MHLSRAAVPSRRTYTPVMDLGSIFYSRGVKLIVTGGHISLMVAFTGPNVILGLYKCNYSLTVRQELRAATG